MAIEYVLVLAGDTPVEEIAERAVPELDGRPVGIAPLLVADLTDRWGFELIVRTGRSRYVSAQGDQGWWEWEPEPFVALTFRMDKMADAGWAVANMLPIVRRVLDTGSENAAFVQNGDVLLLTRFDGQIVKHRRAEWWLHYDGADQLVPG